jgi:hypothetical protein
MKFTMIAVASLAPFVLANPVDLAERQVVPLCSGLEATPQCCATDVLGVADLNCANRQCILNSLPCIFLT